jgi:site-specific DNA-methyltransferase (adenine-specific)
MNLGLTIGHVLDVLASWPAASVHCVVTSPPYWGLRAYSGEQACVWGGDAECEHAWAEVLTPAANGIIEGGMQGETLLANSATRKPRVSGICSLCGAWRGAYGLEPLHDCGRPKGKMCSVCYVCHTLEILRGIRRVLRPDGVVWWNLGDSYAGSGGAHANNVNPGLSKSFKRFGSGRANGIVDERGQRNRDGIGHVPGLKPGDLCMIPQRVALAAQADGWIVRSEVIWAKKNPMPESVSGWRWQRHRVKVTSGRYDSDEKQAITRTGAGFNQRWEGEEGWSAQWQDCPGCGKCADNDGLVLRRGSWRPTTVHEKVLMFAASENYWADGEDVREKHETLGDKSAHAFEKKSNANGMGGQATQGNAHSFHPGGRNLRSVWTLPTVGYPGAHFATFPPALPTRCILAGCPPRVCAKCGTPWARVMKRVSTGRPYAAGKSEAKNAAGLRTAFSGYDDGSICPEFKTLGFRPTCSCGVSEWLPGIVLDPFAGSGTTLQVAQDLGRRWAGIEICEEYEELIRQRLGRVTELPEPAGDALVLPLADRA